LGLKTALTINAIRINKNCVCYHISGYLLFSRKPWTLSTLIKKAKNGIPSYKKYIMGLLYKYLSNFNEKKIEQF